MSHISQADISSYGSENPLIFCWTHCNKSKAVIGFYCHQLNGSDWLILIKRGHGNMATFIVAYSPQVLTGLGCKKNDKHMHVFAMGFKARYVGILIGSPTKDVN